MKNHFSQILFLATGVVVFCIGNATPVLAYEIEDLPGAAVENDFVLGPGKTELWVDPGDEYTKELMITNRLGKTMNFKIEIEDFKGSQNPEETVIFLGEERGPYSLKDYLKPEITEFTLNQGQRMILPVEISIPKDAEPGGLYGAVLVTSNPPLTELEAEKEKAKGQVKLISRLGALFFIRVKGEVNENGLVKDFRIEKRYYEKGPISFEILFQNQGNVHLAPYGIVEIRNILGRKIDEIELDPWFVMPDSLRSREVEWSRGSLFGKYTALASINRGYQDIIDQKSIEFWVIPWKILLGVLVGLFLMIFSLRWMFSRFEIRRKA